MRVLPYLNSPHSNKPQLSSSPGGGGVGGVTSTIGRLEGNFFSIGFHPPDTRQPKWFIALEDCLVDYDCHVEFGGIMVGLLLPAAGGAALFRNVDTA